MPAVMTLVINFSGGKDSSAMLAYLCERFPDVPKVVVMADTGWEHADAIPWGRSICERFGLSLNVTRNAKKDFFSMVRGRGKFPSPGQRQCTSDLKRDPIATWIRRNVPDRLVVNCMGLRAEESPARARALRLSRNRRLTSSVRTVWNWLPIHAWSERRVREYLADRKIPLHSVYNYLNRFSCRVCIYMSAGDLAAVGANDPSAFQRIAELEREIGFTMKASGPISNFTREAT